MHGFPYSHVSVMIIVHALQIWHVYITTWKGMRLESSFGLSEPQQVRKDAGIRGVVLGVERSQTRRVLQSR